MQRIVCFIWKDLFFLGSKLSCCPCEDLCVGTAHISGVMAELARDPDIAAVAPVRASLDCV